MLPKITSARRIDCYDLRNLCINKSWYTCGTNEEYAELFKRCDSDNLTNEHLYYMAADIKKHSETEHEIESIMFELAEIAHTFFEIN